MIVERGVQVGVAAAPGTGADVFGGQGFRAAAPVSAPAAAGRDAAELLDVDMDQAAGLGIDAFTESSAASGVRGAFSVRHCPRQLPQSRSPWRGCAGGGTCVPPDWTASSRTSSSRAGQAMSNSAGSVGSAFS